MPQFEFKCDNEHCPHLTSPLVAIMAYVESEEMNNGPCPTCGQGLIHKIFSQTAAPDIKGYCYENAYRGKVPK